MKVTEITNGKVRCVGYKRNEKNFTIGKVYEVKDNTIASDDGFVYKNWDKPSVIEWLEPWYTFEIVIEPKYKIGDKVRIVKNVWPNERYSSGNVGIGDICTITACVPDDPYPYKLDKHIGYNWCDIELELVESEQKIVITTDGKTTTAKLYENNKVIKTAEAKCSPKDTFDFNFGARLACERLTVKYKFGDKVKVIGNTCNHKAKIGEIITLRDNKVSCEVNAWHYLEHIGYIVEADIEPYVEPPKTEKKESPTLKFKTGDYAKIIDRKHGHEFAIGEIVKLKVCGNYYHATTNDADWWVNDDELEKVEWRVVKRPAKKGDYIRLVRETFSFDKVGDILKTCEGNSSGAHVLNSDMPRNTGDINPNFKWCYLNHHYEVIEPIDTKYYNGEVVCVESNDRDFTVGKIYTIEDGKFIDNDGDYRPKVDERIKTLDDLNNDYFEDWPYKFIPLVH